LNLALKNEESKKMIRIKICIVLLFLLFGCSARMSHQISEIPAGGEASVDRKPLSAEKTNHPPTSETLPLPVPAQEYTPKASSVPSDKSEGSIQEETLSSQKEPSPKTPPSSPERAETIKPDQKAPAPTGSSLKKTPAPPKKNNALKTKQIKPQINESIKDYV
jgi:hypothetical protein